MKIKFWLALFLIVLFGLGVRFYKLGSIPLSLDWDEASLGWNAYSLLKTGTDEYGKALPVSFRSFNDYKPPLYVYSTILPIAVFGLNEFSVRFPSAAAGTLTVLVTFFLVKELLELGKAKEPEEGKGKVALIAAFLLAISPWSIQFSRVAFEANLALFFFVVGGYFLARFLNRKENPALFLAAAGYLSSIYSYHSSRVVAPAFLLGVVIYYRRIFWEKRKVVVIAALFGLVGLYPLVRNTLHTGSLGARFTTVSIFTSPAMKNNPYEIARLFGKNYLNHFNFDFLFLTGDGNGRHHAPDMGVLYLAELPFLLAGLYFLLSEHPKWFFFTAWWFLTAPLASAMTTTTPHAVRALLFLPTYQIFTAYGLVKTVSLVKTNLRPAVFLGISFLFLLNFGYYLHQYFIHYPIESAKDWQYGYKEAVKKVLANEKNFDRIYITSAYDQPYIYFLFYGRIAPTVKNSGYFYHGMDKYEFDLDGKDKNGLYVVSPGEVTPDLKIFDRVNFPDGTPAFLFGRM